MSLLQRDATRLHTVPKCTHFIIKGSKGQLINRQCNSSALVGQLYCDKHIKLYPEIFSQFISAQSARQLPPSKQYKKLKYDFLRRATFKSEYAKHFDSDELLDLKNEIALVSATLNRVYKQKNFEHPKSIELQLKIVNSLRMLIKTLRELEEGKKFQLTFSDMRIFMLNVSDVIKSYIQDPKTLGDIGEQIYKRYRMQLQEVMNKDKPQGYISDESRQATANATDNATATSNANVVANDAQNDASTRVELHST